MNLRAAVLIAAATAAASALAQDAAPAAGTPPPPPPPLAAAPTLSPPAPEASGPALTLEDAIARALDRNFTLVLARYDLASAAESVTAADATFDPTLSLTGSHRFNRAASSGSTIAGTQSENSDLNIGVSQKFEPGTTASVTYDLTRNGNNNPVTTGFNPSYSGNLVLSVRQPLLKGYGTTYNTATRERARLGQRRTAADFKTDVLALVRNVEGAYYNLVFARQQLTVRELSEKVASELLEENKSRKATGVATDLEVLQAQVGVANAERATIQARQTVRDSEDQLLALIGQFEFDGSVGPVAFPTLEPATPSFATSYKLARDNRPELLSSQLSQQQLALDLKTAQKDKLPSLSLGGSLGLSSREGAAGTATEQVVSGDGYAWGVDVSFSMPWGLRAENARLRQAKTALQRESAREQQLEQDLLVQVRSAVRAVQSSTEGARISALATELSQKQFELEKARYEAGLSTFRRVQESQVDYDTARVNELQAQVSLRLAYADLRRLEVSTSLQRYRINLED